MTTLEIIKDDIQKQEDFIVYLEKQQKELHGTLKRARFSLIVFNDRLLKYNQQKA